ncbi:MAG: exodeoxyribonuclease VII large subunit [archaeon]|nr:exodeoxyribonuclease VII large subunit [archaeon]
MSERITVTELNTRVKELFSTTNGLRDIWLVGEISNFKMYTSGHCYFTIKDNGSEIRAVMFKNARARINFNPGDSMKIEAYGLLDMYVERGSYQFIVESMKQSGIGDLYLKYEALKRKLEAEGLFASERKRPLPVYPKTIGVVTSPTGAVIHDILTTTKRLYPVNVLLAPAQVQGEGAAQSIVKGIELLNRVGVDVIIVGRGGGSLEDLWAFNEEPVVRAIVASKVPVISSVGHETDFTLADFAADRRAATPTAAAQMAVRDKMEIYRQLDDYTVRMNKALSSVTDRMRSRFATVDAKLSLKRAQEKVDYLGMKLDDLSKRAFSSIRDRVSIMHRRFASCENRPESALKTQVARKRSNASGLFARVDPDIRTIIVSKQHAEQNLSARLEALSPYSVLDRGYSFVAGPDGTAVTSVKGLQPGSVITVRMRDGKAEANIISKEEKE